ncbi:MAG: septal ring lytic transglycosylase RlpA family protein [Treponema sp.]|nr:septal ring lytic transglycosylase RlpA family protein [Treponema sp.]
MAYWYDQGSGLYASHATLPFGTELIVTNLDNGKQVTVRVGGRIPQDTRWIVDVSPQAADALEMNDIGFTRVRIEEVVKVATAKALRTNSVRLFQQNGRAMILTSGTELTAGHPSLTMGRQIRITNRANGQVVVATIRNRVRASQDRIIEVSLAVARALGVSQGSYVNVTIESIDR